MLRRTVITAAAAAAFALAAGSPGDADAQDKIQIGASLSLTGGLARSGEPLRKGYVLWAEDVNKRGGIMGKQVEMVVYDDQSDSSTAAKLYEKLITEDKVELLIGPYGSSMSNAAAAVVDKHKRALLLPAAGSTKIFERGYTHTFQMFPPLGPVFDPIFNQWAKKFGLKTVAVINSDDFYPKVLGDILAAKAKKAGLDVVVREQFPLNTKDFSSVVLKLRAAKPDILTGGLQLPDSLILMRQLREFNVLPKVMAFSPAPLVKDFHKTLQSDGDFVMADYLWSANNPDPYSKTFVKKYEARWGEAPTIHSAFGWSGGVLLEAAVKKAGSFNDDKIRAAFLELEMPTLLAGPFKIKAPENKQVGHELGVTQWQNGKNEIVWPENIATAPVMIPAKPWNSR